MRRRKGAATSGIAGISGPETPPPPRNAGSLRRRALATVVLVSGLVAGCTDVPLTGPAEEDSAPAAVPVGRHGSLWMPVNAPASDAVSSQLRITPTGLEFGKVQVAKTSPAQSVILTNIGSTAIDLSLAGGGAGVFGGVNGCGATLAPGASCPISYAFRPTTTGPATTTATLSVNGVPYTYDFSGTGVDPVLVSPTHLEFGRVPVGGTAPSQSVTLTNVGTTPLPVSLAGGGAGVFGGVNGCGSTLAPGASCPISYAFRPTTTGAAATTATLSVNGVPYTYDFAGTGVDPVLVSPTHLEFGEVEVGGTAPSQSVRLTNVSAAPVPVSLAGGGAGVFGGVNGCGSTLAPGASCPISYAFKPTTTGPATTTATLSVNGVPYSLEFSGTGIPAGGARTTQLLVTPTRLAFGGVPVGGTAPSQSVTLTNVGTTPLPVSLAGGGAGVFGGVNGCGSVLAPGASCPISYAFRPTTTGAAATTATLSVNGVPYTYDFAGTGVDPVLVSPIGLEFGEVEVGRTAPSQSVRLTNVWTAPVPVSLAGGGAGVFGGVNGCASMLAPGASCPISYAFRPTVTGPAAQTATLSVNSVPFTYEFAGTGVGPQLLVTPTALSFGSVPIGSTAPTQAVTVTNVGLGTVELVFAGGSPGDPFSATQNCANATLGPGDSCHVLYGFSPTAGGLATATSTFALNGQPFSIELVGFGSGDEGPVTSSVVLSPNPVQVGITVALSAFIDDRATGGSDIESAEYSIDGGAWVPMDATDHAFDAPVEDVSASFTAPAAPGDYTTCVRGIDDAGNTGTPECAILRVVDLHDFLHARPIG